MPPVVGQPAPDFSLPSTAGPEISLSGFKDKSNVLLAFFPAAFTGVCTAELCSFSENLDRFSTAGTQVLPISGDHVASLKQFKEKEKMKVNPLSDIKRSVARAYGVLDEDKFTPRRSYFLVDKQGVLRWSHVEEHNGLRRPDEDILAEIAKLPA
jgi:peroxiredoxin